MSYVNNRHTHTIRPTGENVIFKFKRLQNLLIHQNLNFENLTAKQHFLYHALIGESKKKKFYWYLVIHFNVKLHSKKLPQKVKSLSFIKHKAYLVELFCLVESKNPFERLLYVLLHAQNIFFSDFSFPKVVQQILTIH